MNDFFKEAKLDSAFCAKEISAVRKYLDQSLSFSVVGMPGMGISAFLRYLCSQKFAYFVHIDINELANLTKSDFFKLINLKLGGEEGSLQQNILEIKKSLKKLLVKENKIVIVFNHFDNLKKEFSQEFFANLRTLRDVDQQKISMIFSANEPLVLQVPEAFVGGNLNMFALSFFLPLYSKEDLVKLLKLNQPLFSNSKALDLALRLSGGHYQLFLLLLKSPLLFKNPLADPLPCLQLKQLYTFLPYQRRKILVKLALGKKQKQIDAYLLEVGFVKKEKDFGLFTPLFSGYILSITRLTLPALEEKLFKLLKKRLGETISKEEIFDYLWSDHDGQSDWALNSLVYRLKKNPTFASSGYLLENRKKIGYCLIKV